MFCERIMLGQAVQVGSAYRENGSQVLGLQTDCHAGGQLNDGPIESLAAGLHWSGGGFTDHAAAIAFWQQAKAATTSAVHSPDTLMPADKGSGHVSDTT